MIIVIKQTITTTTTKIIMIMMKYVDDIEIKKNIVNEEMFPGKKW